MKRSPTERRAEHGAQLSNTGAIVRVAVADLKCDPRDPHRVKDKEGERADGFVIRYRDRTLPVMFNLENHVLTGWIFVEAARRQGLTHIWAVQQHDLSDADALLFSVAANKLLSLGEWDGLTMDRALRAFEASIPDFSSALIGYAPGELDRIIGLVGGASVDAVPRKEVRAVSKLGSTWIADRHRIACADATQMTAVAALMSGSLAAASIVDPPYGCKVNGFVSRAGLHREFVEGSGEKSKAELLAFFQSLCATLEGAVALGALVYLFIDWRSLSLIQQAGEEVFGDLFHMCVWVKDRKAMGGMYRSQHEDVLIFKKPGASHQNNIRLGKNGRNRSNVWEYPSAASNRKGREPDMLKHHPTPKSVEMIGDIILDCTTRGDIVLDTCLGSGTTLIAAERTQRVCYGMDLDPLYVDVAVRRWQNWTGKAAIDPETGRTFNDIAAEVLGEEAPDV